MTKDLFEETLSDYVDLEGVTGNPYDMFFSEEELVVMREYARLFITLWEIEHEEARLKNKELFD